MKTLLIPQEGRLNIHARKGFQLRFYLNEVPQSGFTYVLIATNDAGSTALTINGSPQTDRVLFHAAELTLATGPYTYNVIVTKLSDGSKRPALTGNLIITP